MGFHGNRDNRGRYQGGQIKLVEPLFVRLAPGMKEQLAKSAASAGKSVSEWLNSLLVKTLNVPTHAITDAAGVSNDAGIQSPSKKFPRFQF